MKEAKKEEIALDTSCAQNDVQSVADIVGPFGPWQRNIFAFFFVSGMFSAWHSLGLAFYAPPLESWCHRDEWYNISKGAQLLEVKSDPDDLRCAVNGTKCSAFEYDDSFYASTITEEWDLVCDKSIMISTIQFGYMFGIFVATFMSQLADKYGRFPMFFAGVIIEVLAGTYSVLATSVYHYTASRFLLAIGNAARWGTGFVLILETVGARYRGFMGIAIEFGWALGYVVLPAVAYWLRDYRHIQLACTLPQVALIAWCWFMPESPRWQLINGRFRAAERTIRKAVAINNSDRLLRGEDGEDQVEAKLKRLVAKYEDEVASQRRSISFFDLWKTPNLRRKTLLIYFTWFVNGFVYYGLSFNTNSLGGNPFVSFAISGAVEFPAYALSLVILHLYGRKLPLSAAMFGAGLAFFLALPFTGNDDHLWLRITFAMFGKFFITCSFAIVYLYSAEIYPTVARSVGVGSSSMCARVGAMMAPFVKELGQSTHLGVAMAIFGLLAVVDGFLILLLPETKGREIPDTVEEAEDFR